MKKANKLLAVAIIFLIDLGNTSAQSFADAGFIRSKLSYSKKFPFLDTSSNYIQYYSSESLSGFFQKLKRADSQLVRILHIGDSHLQADIGAGYTRNRLQEIFGFGGRGSFFPYTIAKTHATYDYEVSGSGKWQRTRNIDTLPALPLGITGISARTEDPSASFSFRFLNERAMIKPEFKKLKIFCSTGPGSFDIQYRLESTDEWSPVECSKLPPHTAAIGIDLPKSPSALSFRVSKTDSAQLSFDIYGLSLETVSAGGILYNSVGINGAKLSSFLRQDLYQSQIGEFSPDLVILDLIANDLAYGDFKMDEVGENLMKCVEKIRKGSPNASILIVGMQDIFLGERNIANAGFYPPLLRKIAAANNVAFYDYYTVSGGRYSMKKWYTSGLSAKDKCHLSPEGYRVKGELFTNAILNSYLFYLNNSNKPLILF